MEKTNFQIKPKPLNTKAFAGFADGGSVAVFECGPFNHLGTSPDMFELRFDGEKTEQIIKFC